MLRAHGMLVAAVFLAVLGGQEAPKAPPQQFSTQQQSARPNSGASPRLEFEVAVIKPAAPTPFSGAIIADPGGQTYEAHAASIQQMIRLMWKLHNTQIVGGPDWVSKDLWDVQAKADRPHSLDDLHAMYQNMVIDRFKMKFHWDTRDLPMYALVQDKSGEKMKLDTATEQFNIPIQGTSLGNLQVTHCDMKYFAWFISGRPWVDRPVVDETGLDKSTFYDFTLVFQIPLEIAERANLPQGSGPDFFTAIREQLGLRLEAKRGPVPVMVIDHIEKPSEADN